MKKLISSIKLKHIVAFLIASALTYYLLLHENCLHTSILEITEYSHNFTIATHILIRGLLPIYIATVIFGATMVGVYLSSILEYLPFCRPKN